MARRRSQTLTEAELRLMDVLWEKGPASVAEVAAALPKRLSLAYNSVLTTLRILEQKGYVRHEKQGRAFVYHPVLERGQARRSALQYVLTRFFNNSPELLVLNVLENERLDPAELRRLRRLIDESE
jgi:predicted transcriptional regulator